MTQLPTASQSGAGRIDGELREMIDWSRGRGSRMGYFAALYTHVETAIAAASARGAFARPDLLARVNERFFARYLEAFDARRRGLPTTGAWQAAFDATERTRLCVLQHLMLGMNAHINFDLPVAVATALDRDELAAFRVDFDRMNALLASLVDEVSSDLALAWPLLRWINSIGRRPDDVIIDFSMRAARDHAWHGALELSPLSGTARLRAIDDLDGQAVVLAGDVARPSLPGRLVAAIVRAGERGSVREIIDDLLR
ncbi:MAG: DUF5995 family protein [Solirubrobacteraceae bacterium]